MLNERAPLRVIFSMRLAGASKKPSNGAPWEKLNKKLHPPDSGQDVTPLPLLS